MIKTILAFLIISPVVAYIIYSLVMYPFLRLVLIYVGGVSILAVALAWATDHIWSLVKSKS